ncbi:MAG: hypothetical protein J5662_01555, partial [Clostridia bacterium]|nr:hypothetical protein [Clostridia bacterium]
DFNCETYNQLRGSLTEFKKLLKDSVHPNDKGHQQYADVMIKALKELFTDGVTAPHNIPDKKLCGNGFMTLNCALAGGISDSNWYLKTWFDNKQYEKDGSQFRYSNNLKSIFPKYLAPKETYNSITFKFTGNSFGILGTVKESATLNVVIDSATEKVIKGVNKAELLEYPVFENLKNTAHTVTVTVNGYPPYVAIAAFVTTKP